MERLRDALPVNSPGRRFAPIGRGFALVGFGRLREVQALVDTVAAISPGAAVGLLGWPIVLGLAPPSSGGARLDSLLALDPEVAGNPGAGSPITEAIRAMARGRPDDAIRTASEGMRPAGRDRLIRRGTAGCWRRPSVGHGWPRETRPAASTDCAPGLAKAGGPNTAETTAFLRFQLALALAADPDTREEGISRLRYSFDNTALYLLPLAYLALGRTYEAAGKRDSAAIAYGRFVRLWDKADPELQGRVTEAREALQRLTAEPR